MKSLFLALTLLFATTLLAQQESPNPQAGSNPSDAVTSRNIVHGCLQGGDHHFTLTDDSGITYQLEGDAAKLREHVGHEIQVAGTVGRASASSSNSTPPDDSQATIQVLDVKHLSSTCKSSK